VLFATKSQLPSAVLNLTEKPRGSLRTAGSARYLGRTSLQRTRRREGELSHSPSKVRRARLPADGRETDGQRTLGSLLEHVGHADVFEAIGAFPDPVCARAFGVDDSLGNAAVQASATVGNSSSHLDSPLAIEVRQQVDEVEVLEEERAVHASSLGHVRVRHGHAIGSSVDAASCQWKGSQFSCSDIAEASGQSTIGRRYMMPSIGCEG
jgi:hypothetical protein